MRRIACFLPLVLTAVLVSGCTPPPAAVAASPEGRLVFVRTGGGAPGLFGVDAGGGTVHRVTRGRDEAPAWSPSGRRLAFVRSRDTGRSFELYVAAADGSRARRITSAGGFAGSPSWTSDGKRLVFSASGGRFGTSRDPNCAPNVWTVRSDGSGLRRLVRRGTQPTLSRDGRRLAFVRPDSQERPWLYLADGAGHGARRVGIGASPSWSPDARRLVAVRPVGPNRMGDLWIVRAADGRATRLTRTPALSEADPSWSPDGDWIAFSMYRTGRQEIHVAPASGGPTRAVTRSSRDHGSQEPAWRPAPSTAP